MRRPTGLLVLTMIGSAAPLVAQAPLRLSFADAVRRATGEAPVVQLATLRTDEARARVREARGALLPALTVSGVWVNRSFNSKSLGITFPTIPGQKPFPELIGPFNNYDGRLTVTQTLFDWASVTRVRAAAAQADGSRAERGVTVEAAAQAAALAYLRAARADAVLAARQADSTIAAELVTLAVAQKTAGVSAALDVTRARTQLVRAAGLLIVARNERDRARIDLGRALGLDPVTPLEPSDTLAGTLGAAQVPGERDAAITGALAARPDLGAELARAAAAQRAGSAIRAERLPRIGVEGDYGSNGPSVPGAIATRQVALEVTLPLLDGFRREARLSEQDAIVRESAVRERDLRQQIAADVEAALLDLHSAQAQQVVALDQLRLAEDELSQSRQRFRAGVAGNIDVIEAQANLIRGRDADIDARFAAAVARVALARAAGVARTLH
ncbi:MAG TPA: TolC family protein [Gemmatimonadales bacterium]|jgi:outer membrane protein TolC|nr:TolC family protein [Gemmatimonadales bacterium]